MSSSELYPSARRKSCAACIKGKRRCNRGHPKCSRCTKLRLDCDYGIAFQEPEKDPLDVSDSTSASPLAMAPVDNLFDFDTSMQWNGSLTELEALCDNMPNMPEIFHKTGPGLGLLIERSYKVPLEVQNVTLANIQPLMKSRMQYGIDIMKSGPRRMVEECKTPWIHAKLYEYNTPRVILDVQSACALHMVKNDINETVVWNNIYARMEDLVSSPLPIAPLDQVARVHAMLAYLTMMVFDGEIRQHARAEAFMDNLESEAYGLCGLMDVNFEKAVSSSLTVYPTTSSSTFWRSWILQESVRRTVITCFFFLSAYHTLKENLKFCDQHMPPPSIWTGSAQLWNAASVNDFTAAWNKNHPIVVRNLDLDELISRAAPDDLDEFSKMLLVAFMGIEDARAWFQSRDSRLS